jgi:hypothetical protein
MPKLLLLLSFTRYVIAIRDKETDKVTFKDAPVFPVNRTIKSLKNAKLTVSSNSDPVRKQSLKRLADNDLAEALLHWVNILTRFDSLCFPVDLK